MSEPGNYYASQAVQTFAISLAAMAVLVCALIQARGCDAKMREEKTARCKAVIEAKADPVTINDACGGQ